MNSCFLHILFVPTGILFVAGSVSGAAETAVARPEVFIQRQHEHSPLSYSNPVALENGQRIRYGVDRHANQLNKNPLGQMARALLWVAGLPA